MVVDTIYLYARGTRTKFYKIPTDVKYMHVRMVSGSGGGGGGACAKWKVYDFLPVTRWKTAGGGGGASGIYITFNIEGNVFIYQDPSIRIEIPLPGLYISTVLGATATGGAGNTKESWGSSPATANAEDGDDGGLSAISIQSQDNSTEIIMTTYGGRGGKRGTADARVESESGSGGSGGSNGYFHVSIKVDNQNVYNRNFYLSSDFSNMPWIAPDATTQGASSTGGDGNTDNNQNNGGRGGTNQYAGSGGKGGYGTLDGTQDGGGGSSPYIEIDIGRASQIYYANHLLPNNTGRGIFKVRANNSWIEIPNVKVRYNSDWHRIGGDEVKTIRDYTYTPSLV